MTLAIEGPSRIPVAPRRGERSGFACYVPGDSPCGVADYQRSLAGAINRSARCVAPRLPTGTVGRHRPAALVRRHLETRRLAAQADRSSHAILPYTDALWNGPRPGESTLPTFLARLRRPALMILHEFPEPPEPEAHRGSTTTRMIKSLATSALVHAAGRRDERAYLRGRIFGRMAAIVVHSDELAERVVSLGIPGRRVLLRPHPIPRPDAATTDAAGVDARFGLRGRRVLLIFGFPDPRKGFDVAIEALASLPEDVALAWAGGCRGPSDRAAAGRLMDRAKALGLAGRFVPVGYLDDADLSALIGRASLGLSPFREATGSGTTARFVASALPVVASDLRPIRATAEAGAGIELVPPGDALALARAVSGLLDDAPRRAAMAAASRDFADRHSFEGLAAELVGLATGMARGEGGR